MNEMKKYLLLFMVISAVFPINAQVESWNPDWDGDNNVGVSDLLGLLSVFGDYDLDNDGIWDSVDDCVGEYDECGVCNGEGIPEGFCTCELAIDAVGECGGHCISDNNGWSTEIYRNRFTGKSARRLRSGAASRFLFP